MAVGLLVTLMFTVTVVAGVRPRADRSGGDVVPGVVLVAMQDETTGGTLKAPASLAAVSAAFQRAGVVAVRQAFPSMPDVVDAQRAAALRPLGRIMACTVPMHADPRAVAAELARAPGVAYAVPEYVHTLYDTPNDALFSLQASPFTQMNATAGWSLAKGSPSVLIATIDGGTYWRHEDLLPNVRINSAEDVNHNGVFDAGDNNGIDDDGNGFIDDVVGWNFANNTNDPSGLPSMSASYAHGTATASHFGAVSNNTIGMAGSGWNCALLPVCAASATSDNSIAYGYEGIVYAAARGAAVINCSWGRLGGFSRFEQDVITAVTNAGSLVVAAAGNDNTDLDAVQHFPACYRGVLAVGATFSTTDERASFSNYGTNVPVFAPGVSILSAFVGGGYGNGGSGTSYSSPMVAGLAGLIKSAHPSWTPAQIAAQIRSTADNIESVNPSFVGKLGKGRVNFARALSENNPAVEVISSSVTTSDGRAYFLPGDTIQFTVAIRNPLFATATNVSFTATSSTGTVTPVQVPDAVPALNAGQSLQLVPFRFKVGAVGFTTNVVLTIRWSINGSNGDGFAASAMLFPVAPQWMMQVDGSDAAFFSVCAVSPSVVWVSGGSGTATLPMVLRSTDGGSTWSDHTGNLSGVDLYCITALDANRAWVGTSDGKLFATTNGGANWVQQSYPLTQSPFIDGIKFFQDGTGYALGDPASGDRFVILKTTDFGGTWSHALNEPVGSSGEAGWNNSFWWTDAQHGWFGTNHGKVWRTTNGGTTWSSGNTGSSNSFGVAFRDTLTGYAVHDAGYVARSTNGGQTWSALTTPTNATISAVAVPPGTPAVWAVTAGGLYHSRNEGATWTTETAYPYVGSLNHVSFADTSSGWAVTSFGEVLRFTAPLVTGIAGQAPPDVPVGFAMLSSYPNPFNGGSRIAYRIPGNAACQVNLRVIDVLGREVDRLVAGTQEPGEHVVVFDARGRASGVYVVVLDATPVAGGAPFRLTHSMILLR